VCRGRRFERLEGVIDDVDLLARVEDGPDAGEVGRGVALAV
jgi:hypothetical protein